MSLELHFDKRHITNTRGFPTPGFEIWFDVSSSGNAHLVPMSTRCSIRYESNSSNQANLLVQSDASVVFHAAVIGEDGHCTAAIKVPLGFEVLKAVEQLRQGQNGPVCFLVDMDVACSEVISPNVGNRLLGVPKRIPVKFDGHDRSEYQLKVSRDEWLALLRAMGFADIEVFELPVYKHPGLSGLSMAVSELRAAESSLGLGDWPTVMAKTRRAFECVASSAGGAKNTAEGFRAFWLKAFPNDSEKELRDALDSVVKSLDHLQNLGRHKKAPFPDIQRPEALLVLRQTLSLFEYLGEKMKASSIV